MGRYTLSLSNISSWSDAYAVPAVILREELLKQKAAHSMQVTETL